MSSSPSKSAHISYNTNLNQKDIIHPKQPESKQSSHNNMPQPQHHSPSPPFNTDRNSYQHEVDKIHFKSTNRSSHHEVSADNWRIRYYMNLNLVKQPQHIMQYRSSSLPHPSSPIHAATNMSNDTRQTSYECINRSRKSIERKHEDMDVEDIPIFIEQQQEQEHDEAVIEAQLEHEPEPEHEHTEEHIHSYPKPKKKANNKSKRIHIIHKTRSQNNTPPRQFPSLLRKHHKRCRLSRLRSRSDGSLSFHAKQKSISVESNEDDDDNDSVSTADSVNNHHLNALNAIHINNDITLNISNGLNLTPPGTSSKYTPLMKSNHLRTITNSSSSQRIIYPSSRTPPGIQTRGVLNHNSRKRNRFESEPIQYHQSQSIAVRRSKPLVIHKHKMKARFDVDFHDANATSYEVSSPELLFNTEYLVDDEANFEMD